MESTLRIFDSHSHYTDEKFDEDRDVLLPSLHENGIARIMNASVDTASSRAALALAEKYPFVYASAGIHPHEAEKVEDGYLDEIRELLSHKKVRALGEIGLDYFYDFSPRDIQKRVFEEQLALAKELDVPVIIHSREAVADTIEILGKYRPKGVIHCFSGSKETARTYIEMGLYIGFTGILTFPNARKAPESLSVIPDDRLLIETDCPYMAPVPYRGKRCDSSMIPMHLRVMAAHKGHTLEEMAEITYQNASRLFEIED